MAALKRYRQEIRLLSKNGGVWPTKGIVERSEWKRFFFVEAVAQRNASCVLEEAYGRHGNI